MKKNYEIEMFEECLMKEIGPKDYDCYEKKLAETVKEEFLKDENASEIMFWTARNIVEYGEDHADMDGITDSGIYDNDGEYYSYGKSVLEKNNKACLLPSGEVLEVYFC